MSKEKETTNLNKPKIILVKARQAKSTPLEFVVHQIVRDLDEKKYSEKSLEKDNKVEEPNKESNIEDFIVDIIGDFIETIEKDLKEETPENENKESKSDVKPNEDKSVDDSVKKEEVKEEKISNLDDTIVLMNSVDYKKRFKAEYYQTKIRYDKLHNMITSYEAGTLSFEPTCSLELLQKQASAMGQYLHVLEVRAKVEGINL